MRKVGVVKLFKKAAGDGNAVKHIILNGLIRAERTAVNLLSNVRRGSYPLPAGRVWLNVY